MTFIHDPSEDDKMERAAKASGKRAAQREKPRMVLLSQEEIKQHEEDLKDQAQRDKNAANPQDLAQRIRRGY